MAMRKTQIKKYERQIILPPIGCEGQERILEAKVLLVGLGGIGSPCALYLAAAGVGTLGIVDQDVVKISDLHRQILHSTKTLGRSKVFSAQQRLRDLNRDVKVVAYNTKVTAENVCSIIRDYDIIVDASDNFLTRYLVNDACVVSGKRLVHGSVFWFEGHVFTILPGKSACYRCLFPYPVEEDRFPIYKQRGVYNIIAGMVGVLQANEVLKCILGVGKSLHGTLLFMNVLDNVFNQVTIHRDPQCKICGRLLKETKGMLK